MTVVEPTGGSAPGLVDRAKNILFQPASEWDRIKGEQTPLAALLTGYVLPLAALSALCTAIGLAFIGAGAFGISVKLPIVSALVQAVIQVVVTLLGVFIMALIVNALAPSFGSVKDQGQANKLAAYSATAGLLGGVFTLLPALSPLALIASIYSLVLLYLGLPRLMSTPQDKRVGYFVTILVVCLVIGIVLGMVLGAVRMAIPGMGMPGFAFNAPTVTTPDAKVTLPGGVTIDTQKAEQAAQQMEQALAGVQSGAVSATPIDVNRLAALLPAALPGGFTKTESSSGSGGAMGMNIGNAQAVYTRGDSRLTLEITDMGAAGAFAGMAAAMNVQSSRETADGYERTQTVDGRMVTEEVNRSANSAHYQVVTTNRIAVDANGSNVTIDEVKAAVASVLGPAEALARGT